jgi:flagellin-specific chaperone FliS
LAGKPRKAYQDWLKCLACAEELSMPLEQGLAHYEIGRHLSSNKKVKNGWGRQEHLQRAIDIFSNLGANHDLKCARIEYENENLGTD